MRKVVYSVAASLDGYIAGPEGEYDWIPMDPEIDFAAMFSRFDALLMGRKSYEVAFADDGEGFGMTTYVFSSTLRSQDVNMATVVSDDAVGFTRELRAGPGKDIWLFGGGQLFRSFLEADLVDVVEVAVLPILLGKGIPLLPLSDKRVGLKLMDKRIYENTGTVMLNYEVRQ